MSQEVTQAATVRLDYSALTTAAVRQLLNKGQNVISMANAGKTIGAQVVSATYGYYDQTNDLLKDIYNLNAYKAETIDSQEFHDDFKKAIDLEKAGDAAGAHDILNKLLNNARVSFSVINRDGMKRQFSAGEPVRITLAIVTSKAGRESIGVQSMFPAPVETMAKRSFHLPE